MNIYTEETEYINSFISKEIIKELFIIIKDKTKIIEICKIIKNSFNNLCYLCNFIFKI